MRWSLNLRGNSADAFALGLMATDDYSDEFRKELVSYLDLREFRGKRNPKRWDRLGVYRRLVGAVQRAKAYVRKPLQTLEAKFDWFCRSVAPTFALLTYSGMDPRELAAMGQSRWKPRDWALLNVGVRRHEGRFRLARA